MKMPTTSASGRTRAGGKFSARKTTLSRTAKPKAASSKAKSMASKARTTAKSSARRGTKVSAKASTKGRAQAKAPARKPSASGKAGAVRKTTTAARAGASRKTATSARTSASRKTGSARKTGSSTTGKQAAGAALTTTNHAKIQQWAEARRGKPATVKSTRSKNQPGVLRIDFPGFSGAGTLQKISWNEWFQKFDQSRLSFLYQDKTKDGKQSRFFKLVKK